MKDATKSAGRNGVGTALVLSALVMVGSVVSCGDEFGSKCMENRTCAATGGEPSEQAGGDSGAGATESPGGNASGGADAASAGNGGASSEDLPPLITAMSPAADATDAEPDGKIVITFSEPLDPDSVTADSVRILDGDVVVPGTLKYADGVVTFTPTEPLSLLVEYSVRVSTDIVDLQGDAMVEDYAATFVTRDGVWHAVELASGVADYYLPTSIPMAANGDTLLTWNLVLTNRTCTTGARWFNRGKPVGASTTFITAEMDDCIPPSLDANAAGVAGLFSGGLTVDQQGTLTSIKARLSEYRDGTWTQAATLVAYSVGVGVAPDDSVSYIAQGSPGAQAFHAKKVVEIGGAHLSGFTPQIAFAAKGNGFAAWNADIPGTPLGTDGADEVVVARYTVAGGWEVAAPLPGSVATAAGPNNERGLPALAVDEAGGAMVIWAREINSPDGGALMASRYTTSGGWDDPVALTGTTFIKNAYELPNLVFDGDTYVAAWVGNTPGGSPFPYTARYDMKTAKWDALEPRSDVAIVGAMPRLGSDAHHNLLMSWIAPSPKGAALAYARYIARTGEWTEPMLVAEGDLGVGYSSVGTSPLSVNANGLGALIWSVAPDNKGTGTIHYASFH